MLEPQDQIPWYVWIFVAFIFVSYVYFVHRLTNNYGVQL